MWLIVMLFRLILIALFESDRQWPQKPLQLLVGGHCFILVYCFLYCPTIDECFTLDLIQKLIGIYTIVIYVFYESAHYILMKRTYFRFPFNNHFGCVFVCVTVVFFPLR